MWTQMDIHAQKWIKKMIRNIRNKQTPTKGTETNSKIKKKQKENCIFFKSKIFK